MCHPEHSTSEALSPVRLFQCEHGTFHLNVNGVTLHLHPHELALVGKAINTWAQRHPDGALEALQHLEALMNA